MLRPSFPGLNVHPKDYEIYTTHTVGVVVAAASAYDLKVWS